MTPELNALQLHRAKDLLDRATMQLFLLECCDDPYERRVINRRAELLIAQAIEAATEDDHVN